MHVGGLYCCSGQGYTGRYLNGTIDELRIWTRSLTGIELNSKMRTPLAAGDEEGLLFYFPLDEAGMETGANVIESRALPWYAMLGNAAGSGRLLGRVRRAAGVQLEQPCANLPAYSEWRRWLCRYSWWCRRRT